MRILEQDASDGASAITFLVRRNFTIFLFFGPLRCRRDSTVVIIPFRKAFLALVVDEAGWLRRFPQLYSPVSSILLWCISNVTSAL